MFSISGPSIALAAILSFCCAGCSRLPPGTLLPAAVAETEGTSTVRLLVATSRIRSATDDGSMFGTERADQASYASIGVSIPPDAARKIGQVQWPTSLPGDPRQSFVTVSADHLDKRSFTAALSAAAKGRARGKVLLFVHGFNNRFDEAVYRFAQIVHDSGAPAVPVLFSWPSRGAVSLRAYRDDLESATASRDVVDDLLESIAQSPNVKEVTVLCHSMGCSLTLQALWSRAGRIGKVGAKIKNVLLVAPDIDVDVFRKKMHEMQAGPRFALFLSQDDGALKLSKSIWGGVTRLGDVDPDQEPYRSDFRRHGILVFDLTHLRGDAHSRAFEDVTSVMGMIEARLAAGQEMTEARSVSNPSSE